MSFAEREQSEQAPTFVSLYTGAGGMDLGFIDAGFTPVFANDIDPYAVETYNRTIKRLADERENVSAKHRAVCGDIREVEVDFTGIDAGFVIGGPPCQGFSVAGRMNPDDPRSRHVFDFMTVVEMVQPNGFVMENVKALAINSRWHGIRDALRSRAEALGYETELYVLNASHYGVPQARERMFFVGSKSGKPAPPTPTTLDDPSSVRSVLEALPKHGEIGNDRLCTAKVTPAKNPVLRKSPYAGMLFNGQGRPLDLDQPSSTLPASMGGNRTPIIDQEQLDSGCRPWVREYHSRLMNGRPPLTKAPRRLRRLTVDEAAAIQTFPADIEWAGPPSAQFRQIGNAVPPGLAAAVAESMLR